VHTIPNVRHFLVVGLLVGLTVSAVAGASTLPGGTTARIPFVAAGARGAERGDAFYARTFAGRVAVRTDGTLAYWLPKPSPRDAATFEAAPQPPDPVVRQAVVLHERLDTARPLRPEGREKSPAVINRLVGNPSEWERAVPAFDAVRVGEPWPGITVEVRAHGRNVEKIFTVAPGADPGAIRVAVQGGLGLRRSPEGALVVATALGDVAFTPPVAYQWVDGQRRDVAVEYDVTGESYGFALGSYDPSRPLIVDPLLGSTYLGGSGADVCSDMVLAGGYVYVVGQTSAGDFPTTPGAYDRTGCVPWMPGQPDYDAFVSKFDGSLSNLLASTFLGGGMVDVGQAIAADTAGNLVVAGYTASSNFPTTVGAYDRTHAFGETKFFVTTLNPALSQVVRSTFIAIGGNGMVMDLAVDRAGNTYLLAYGSGTGFPATAGAYDTTPNGGLDVMIARLNATFSQLLGATYLGSAGDDAGNSLVLDPQTNVYVTGTTTSSGFPTTAGAFDRSYNGGHDDGFIVQLSRTLGSLRLGTFLGGSKMDGVSDLLIAGSSLYVAGGTGSSNFPVRAGGYDVTYNGGTCDVFVAKMDLNVQQVQAGTFIGGRDLDSAHLIRRDSAGNIYVAGRTMSSNYPTTSGAYDRTYNGHGGDYGCPGDVLISKLNGSLSNLLASTYLGGAMNDDVHGLERDAAGNLVLAGGTSSSNFPTTTGAYDRWISGPEDGFVTRIDANLSAGGGPPPTPTGVSASDGTYTAYVKVTWNASAGATSYEVWRGTNSSVSKAGKLTTVAATSVNDTNAYPGRKYYYWVRAKNAAGTSAYSASDSGYRKLSAPTGVAASDGLYTEYVKITWRASTGATSYEVWRGTNASVSKASLLKTVTPTNTTDTTAVPERRYYYWVRARNALCTSWYSGSNTGYRASDGPPIPEAATTAAAPTLWAWASSSWSDEHGADRLIDGDTNTLWAGAADGAPWRVAVDFGRSVRLGPQDVLWAGAPWLPAAIVGSTNAEDWFDLGIAPTGMPCRYLYLNLAADPDRPEVPAIREVLPEAE
jgi:hypothetical protein